MKRLYRKRSDIVHGNIKESNQQEKETVAKEFEESIRIELKKYLERFTVGNYQEHGRMIQGIDFD